MSLRAKAIGSIAPRKLLNDPLRGQETTLFADHAGETAISASVGRRVSVEDPILPPLWAFQVYITNGLDVSTGHDVCLRLLTAMAADTTYSIPFRIDVYFLPDTDTESCMAHYRAEKLARNTDVMSNSSNRRSHSSSHSTASDPVQPMSNPLPVLDPFRDDRTLLSVLVQIEHSDWEQAGATLVYFDCDSSAYYGPDEEVPPEEVTIRRSVPWRKDREAMVVDATLAAPQTHLGRYLEHLRYDGGRCDDLGSAYEERLAQGHSDWAGFTGRRTLFSLYQPYEFRTAL